MEFVVDVWLRGKPRVEPYRWDHVTDRLYPVTDLRKVR